jgi:hypothetical protein
MNKKDCNIIINKFFKNINELKSYKEDYLTNSDDLNTHVIYFEKLNEKKKEFDNYFIKNKDNIEHCFKKYYHKY